MNSKFQFCTTYQSGLPAAGNYFICWTEVLISTDKLPYLSSKTKHVHHRQRELINRAFAKSSQKNGENIFSCEKLCLYRPLFLLIVVTEYIYAITAFISVFTNVNISTYYFGCHHYCLTSGGLYVMSSTTMQSITGWLRFQLQQSPDWPYILRFFEILFNSWESRLICRVKPKC